MTRRENIVTFDTDADLLTYELLTPILNIGVFAIARQEEITVAKTTFAFSEEISLIFIFIL